VPAGPTACVRALQHEPRASTHRLPVHRTGQRRCCSSRKRASAWQGRATPGLVRAGRLSDRRGRLHAEHAVTADLVWVLEHANTPARLMPAQPQSGWPWTCMCSSRPPPRWTPAPARSGAVRECMAWTGSSAQVQKTMDVSCGHATVRAPNRQEPAWSEC